jgi:hypothetical protein
LSEVIDFNMGNFVKKPLNLPPSVARAFGRDMKAYFAEGSAIKRDAIAARQLHALKEHEGPREKALRLSDVKQMFLEMKGIAG